MKRIFAIFIMLAAILSQARAGDLEFCGNTVNLSTSKTYNSSNCSDIKSGYVYWNATEKTLKFVNATIETGSDRVVFVNYLQGLTIIFEGTCSLKSSKCVMRIDRTTAITGTDADVTLEGTGSSAEAIYIYRGENKDTPYANIVNMKNLRCISKGDYGIEGDRSQSSGETGSLRIANSRVTAIGEKGSIYSKAGHLLTYYATYESILATSHTIKNGTVLHENSSFNNTTPATDSVRFVSWGDYYGVRVNGVAITKYNYNKSEVTSLGVTFVPSTSTLNIYAAKIDASTNYDKGAAISTEKYGINIVGKNANGSFIYGRGEALYVNDVTTIQSDNELHFYGGYNNSQNTWFSSGAGIILNNRLDIKGTGTFGSIIHTAGYQYGICGTAINSKLVVDNAKLWVYRRIDSNGSYTPFTRACISVTDLSLNRCSVTSPEDAEYRNNSFYTDEGVVKDYLTIEPWSYYSIWMNGTQVHDGNRKHLETLIGAQSGSLYYTPKTNVLTFSGLNVDKSSSSSTEPLIRIDTDAMDIRLEGHNNIKFSPKSRFGLMFNSTINISSEDYRYNKFVLSGSPTEAYVYSVNHSVNISNAALVIQGNGNTTYGVAGYNSGCYLNIDNSQVSIEGVKSQPLAINTRASGVEGTTTTGETDITIHPTRKRLVYAYDGQDGPSNDEVREPISIYPLDSYYLEVNGSTPQGYTSSNGVCFDEFSKRLYLRNANVSGLIRSNLNGLRIYTVGNSTVTSSVNLMYFDNFITWFKGPGRLTLLQPDTEVAAIGILTEGGLRFVNTTVAISGKGTCLETTDKSYDVVVDHATLSASCEPGYAVMRDFNSLKLNECCLITPKDGYYLKKDMLYNANGLVANKLYVSIGLPTDIEDTPVSEVNDTAQDGIYDLQGRRVEHTIPGTIYLVRKNGKTEKILK